MSDAIPPRYGRIILKISGESLGDGSPLDPEQFRRFANQVEDAHGAGSQVLLVVGGGNLFRGSQHEEWGIRPAEADTVGMVATGMNVLLMAGMLDSRGIQVSIFSRGPCTGIGSTWEPSSVRNALDGGHVVLLAGGLGLPGMSTDVPALHAAAEVDADAVVMFKHGVDGVYDADPRVTNGARKLLNISASEALSRQLAVMDLAALRLAVEHNKPVHILSAKDAHGLQLLLRGCNVGSLIEPV